MALIKQYKICGATLIESMTALAIVCTVMGTAFTLYEKIAARQQQVMKTRARYIQVSAEQYLQNTSILPDLSNDFVTVTVEMENFRQQNDLKLYTLTFSTAQGKKIIEKKYLKYQVENEK